MGSRDKVLIVDDSELDRIALKKMLKDAYEIVEAVDGAGALRILESQKEFDAISAIILDLVMPQMGGFEFLREYRKVVLIVGTGLWRLWSVCQDGKGVWHWGQEIL